MAEKRYSDNTAARSQAANSNRSKTKGKRGRTKRDIISRVKSLYAAFILIGILVVLRLVWVIWISPSVRHNAEVMDEGIYRFDPIVAHQGTILSRNGEPLAISSLRYDVVLDFRSEGMLDADTVAYKTHVDSLARMLARYFTPEDAEANGYEYTTAEEYRQRLISEQKRARNRGFRVMPRIITTDEWDHIRRTFPIFNGNMGNVFKPIAVPERLYPSGDVARQIIGRHDTLVVNGRKVPGSGIEIIYHDDLKGRDGRCKEQWIAHGFWARVSDPENIPAENGCNVITTIDADLQRVAHERLDTMLRRQKASFGVAMVMEVATGNILTMVSLGTAPVRGTTYSERVNNYAINTRMCPGSTMKLATAMALLEIGGYTLDTKVNTEHSDKNHSVMVGAAKVSDTHDVAGAKSDGFVTLKDAFAHSSNVYFAKAVYEKFADNPAKYTSFLASLGFTSTVGLEAYSEIPARMKLADTPEWNVDGSTASRLPRMAFGYEVETTPIQMLTFYNGVANEGRMVAPRLVDRIERDGEVVRRTPIVTLNERMCSKKTLALLDSCLAAASLRTGTKFRNLPIPFGCKTGTAEVWSTFVSRSPVDHEHMKNGLTPDDDHYYYGSIVCTMPQEKPKYTIMVAVCKQAMYDSDTHYGIDLAGPVASDIMEYIYSTDPTLHASIETPPAPYSPTSIKAGNTRYVAEVSRALAPQTVNESDGNAWSSTSIDVGGHTTIKPVTTPEGTVPNVHGMGLSDALYLLESSGLTVTHTGTGRVKSQSIPAGRKLSAVNNGTIHLTLAR